ncbi:hypothetical protein J5N97_025947 [Dioscorea zingiberensis]|uniref:SWIM-type domain-containing protein n=1 Tax=Dioscorea zingiberensis TaxID=325984 RepID=A0A9D5C2J0_9LILI|nr:hypothetical protein J5N97_025947 [Dioscorea zingiberensis]
MITGGGRYNSSQLIADRIVRAIHHRLRLLHRSNSEFFILGATGNVYTVTLAAIPSCTCPDRTVPCKHILFVLLRVLRLPFDDVCLRRRTLRPCHLARLLAISISTSTLAGPRARARFYQLYSAPAAFQMFPDWAKAAGGRCIMPLRCHRPGDRETVAAVDIIQSKDPDEASSIFTEGKRAVISIKGMEKEVEKRDQLHKLVEASNCIEEIDGILEDGSWDFHCSGANSNPNPAIEECCDAIIKTRKPLSSPF